MSAYSDFFLGSPPQVVHLELIEISHFRFTQTYRFVRNAVAGITVTHESPPGGNFAYTYLPMQIRRLGSSNDLDQSLRIQLGDVSTIVAKELDSVFDQNGMDVKPTLKYRVYRSDTLTAPIFGPTVHEIANMSMTKEGVAFDAVAPRLNLGRTGKLYVAKDFPMLKPFFKNGF